MSFFNKKKILVVEDSKELFEAIEDRLEKDGFKVYGASNAADAIKTLESHGEEIAVVWLDHYLLGEGSGVSVASYIKKSPTLREMPIIVVTVSGTEYKKQYEGLGVTAFLEKSNHSLDELVDEVRKHV